MERRGGCGGALESRGLGSYAGLEAAVGLVTATSTARSNITATATAATTTIGRSARNGRGGR